MVHFTTCVGCKKRGDCTKQDQIKAAIKGSGTTSLKHRCADRECLFAYGQPVIIRTYSGHDDEEYFSHPFMGDFPGYFLGQKGSKAVCFIREDTLDLENEIPFAPKGKGFVKVPLSRIKDNPEGEKLSTDLCELCKDPVAITGQCGGFGDLDYAGTLCAFKRQLHAYARGVLAIEAEKESD